MSDRPRHAPHTAPRDHADDAGEAGRESRVEQLLLAGLDQYFAGRYEQAIDIWTRVAFLDRRNSRAKAYIDRARGLVAERQREDEALVQEGVAAYQAGNLPTARAILTRAAERGAHGDTARLFLDRLQRSEPLPAPAGPAREAAGLPMRAPAAWSWVTTAATSAALAAIILIGARPLASWVAELPLVVPDAPPAAAESWPLARASDRVLAEARRLMADGRGAEALRALEAVDIADAQRPAADALRGQIQRQLLATVQTAELTPEGSR
jgi:hypothetical protein